MDLSDSFRIINLAVGVIMILGGVSQFFSPSFKAIVIGVYVIIFGLVNGLLEFQIPPQVSRYASFLFSFIGRGIFYIFIGIIILDPASVWKIICGSIVGLVGVAYAALEFIPSIEPPANMREADAGWGAEQV
ncbi:Golgi apparatus membrane protein TVP15 [Coniochaeta sp. 2T2.1]|nr:Golgi apparatus membrane protein TVP15 [Coniochaeta sp. 2T2.1]KAB5532577.1 Golgi apparatus membrane protein TVP15 [Coniochaeta sp. 2T2.1]